MQEQILQLILDKVSKIEIDQQEMRKDLQEVKNDQQEMRKESQIRFKNLEDGQEKILEFMKNMEGTLKNCEQDQAFIEKLKKVVGE